LSLIGVVTSLQVCPGHGQVMRPVDPAVFLPDRGLQGCYHGIAGSRRQVLLIEEEILDDVGIDPGIVKENVTTRGIDLTALPTGTRLRLAEEVELWITGPCKPCGLLDQVRPGLQGELDGKRGVLAWVKHGGVVRPGDRIQALVAGSEEG
jgi:MOSC domain-containing protein YiiM